MEEFHTPKQTPSVTERRRRKHRESYSARSPIVSCSYILTLFRLFAYCTRSVPHYHIQVINLDLCEDDLKKEIARQEQIIAQQTDLIQVLFALLPNPDPMGRCRR